MNRSKPSISSSVGTVKAREYLNESKLRLEQLERHSQMLKAQLYERFIAALNGRSMEEKDVLDYALKTVTETSQHLMALLQELQELAAGIASQRQGVETLVRSMMEAEQEIDKDPLLLAQTKPGGRSLWSIMTEMERSVDEGVRLLPNFDETENRTQSVAFPQQQSNAGSNATKNLTTATMATMIRRIAACSVIESVSFPVIQRDLQGLLQYRVEEPYAKCEHSKRTGNARGITLGPDGGLFILFLSIV
eukprot:CAMPEP_0168829570 /NCGR_PEP_ID=MMETSP0727-20121128/1087_1 /TAXON_ID=265536 /ORGANISM="Amphiprora sp., Strain CCMP467" /LENGTH=248 /DNA_ID=CAMNT_0008882781 /DNA_START=69 /DNA_END=812 /DNA_ORIENTATION=+